MKMKAVLSVLLLAGMTGAGLGLILKKHIFVNMKLNWSDAQEYCRSNYLDLSSIETQDELNTFLSDTANSCTAWCWISSRKVSLILGLSQWYDGREINYTNWNQAFLSSDSFKSCLSESNLWFSSLCTKTLPLNFVCYSWEPKLVVVQEMKTWDEALKYCRTMYTDMVSLSTEMDQLTVNNKRSEVLTPRFWTSLRFLDGSWFWVNQATLLGNFSFMPTCPAPRFRCGARKAESDVLENRDCEEKMNFICYHSTW